MTMSASHCLSGTHGNGSALTYILLAWEEEEEEEEEIEGCKRLLILVMIR